MNTLIRTVASLRWSLGSKFGAAVVIIIAILILFFGLIGSVGYFLQQTDETQIKALAAQVDTETMRSNVNEQVNLISQSAAGMNSDPQNLGAVQDAEFNKSFQDLAFQTNNDPKLTSIKTLYATFKKDISAAVPTDRKTIDKVIADAKNVNDKIMDLETQKVDEATQARTDRDLKTHQIEAIGLLGIVMALIMAIIVTLVLREVVRRPVQAIMDQLSNVASGNLNTKVSVVNGDEIGALANEVNFTVTNLRQAIEKLKSESASVQSAAAEIATISTQQARGSTEQVTALGQLSTTLEEMGQTAHMIAEGARVVVEVAHRALEIGEQGTLAVQHALTGVNQLRQEVANITERILGVNTQAQQVTTVVDIISSIAHATHLLALNASIEAAGAGEQGSRFSVVASEVKKLARHAQTEAQKVRNLVEMVQQATGTAVMATEQGMKEAEHLSTLSEQAGSAISQIMEVLHETTNQAQAIALATQQQQTGSEQMLETMRRIGQVSRDSSQAATQIAATAQELNHASVELRDSVARFEHD